MSNDGATVLRESLLGVKFMRDDGFIHRDLKPGNIGIDVEPIRVVLLDVGTADYLRKPGDFLTPTPGCRGTVRYLARECELEPHNASVDI